MSAIPGTIAIFVVLALVRDSRVKAAAKERPAFRLRHLGRPFALFTAASAVFALGNSSDAMLILRAQDLGAAPALVPLMYFAFNVVAAALAAPFGVLSDRIGRRHVLAAGFAGYALVYAGFALARGAASPWVLFALCGVPYAMTEGLARAYVVDLVPAEARAVPFAVSAALMTGAALWLALQRPHAV